jgi:hypothetical protein
MMVRRAPNLDVFWGCRAFPACAAKRRIDQQTFNAFIAAHRKE